MLPTGKRFVRSLTRWLNSFLIFALLSGLLPPARAAENPLHKENNLESFSERLVVSGEPHQPKLFPARREAVPATVIDYFTLLKTSETYPYLDFVHLVP